MNKLEISIFVCLILFIIVLVAYFLTNKKSSNIELYDNPEVYVILKYIPTGNGTYNVYSIPKNEASSVASMFDPNGVNATYNQVQDLISKGVNMCRTGWVSDKPDAYYPMSRSFSGCGQANQMNLFNPSSGGAGVWVYGRKPKNYIDAQNVNGGYFALPFSVNQNHPGIIYWSMYEQNPFPPSP